MGKYKTMDILHECQMTRICMFICVNMYLLLMCFCCLIVIHYQRGLLVVVLMEDLNCWQNQYLLIMMQPVVIE